MKNMRFSFLVSWRNLTRHKTRFFLTLIAMILGVTVMTSMLIAKETTIKIMDEQEQLYAGDADYWIKSNQRFFSESEVEWVTDRKEVGKGVAALLKQGFINVEAENLAQASVRITGVSSYDHELIELPVKEGDVTKEGLIITENAAALWGKGVGDTVTFQDMGQVEVTAVVYEGAMLSSPKTLEGSTFRDARVMVPLDTLQEWTGMEGQISNYRFSVKGEKQPELLEAYQAHLEGSQLFVQPVVVDSQQNNDVEGLYFTFDIIAILSIFISAFIVFNMLYTTIVERRKEFALMKSLGYTNEGIRRLIINEIGVLAVIGSALGLPLGVWLGSFLQEMFMSAIATQTITYELELIKPLVISGMVGLAFPYLAVIFPIYQAGKTSVMEAISESPINRHRSGKGSLIRILAGVICTGIGLIDNPWAFLLLFVGLVLLYPIWIKLFQWLLQPLYKLFFRYAGEQAIRSVKQFENRNVNTSAMLAIGVSLALFMSAALESLPDGIEDDIHATFGGDIHVEKESPWIDADLERINELEGVSDSIPYAEIPNITWQTKTGELREFSIISYTGEPQNAELFAISQTTEEQGEHPAIFVGERALTEWGGELGEDITLNTPSGPVTFFVKGTVQTSHYMNYVAFIEDSELTSTLNWPEKFHVIIDASDEGTIPIVFAQLWSSFEDSIVNVNPITVSIEQGKQALTGMQELLQGLLLLIIALSAIGISNTLLMNTMERIKELGTMRAIGFTRTQVKVMIMAEGLMIGITGIIIGTLYGILVIYLNAHSAQGQALLSFTVPGMSLFLAIAGGLLFTLLASWFPSRTASHIPVKEAINYE
ncbi:ABC transporter permease [Gracilibacillus saliphilus]|uniref:ABC transporter permease n=1 Tax=Gracilibacillus saliphilus TaxID=543890 RepID=UPI00307DB342